MVKDPHHHGFSGLTTLRLPPKFPRGSPATAPGEPLESSAAIPGSSATLPAFGSAALPVNVTTSLERHDVQQCLQGLRYMFRRGYPFQRSGKRPLQNNKYIVIHIRA